MEEIALYIEIQFREFASAAVPESLIGHTIILHVQLLLVNAVLSPLPLPLFYKVTIH